MLSTEYYRRGVDLSEEGFAPDLFHAIEEKRGRLGNRALHTLIRSDVRTFEALEALGYKGLLGVAGCGAKTAALIMVVLGRDKK